MVWSCHRIPPLGCSTCFVVSRTQHGTMAVNMVALSSLGRMHLLVVGPVGCMSRSGCWSRVRWLLPRVTSGISRLCRVRVNTFALGPALLVQRKILQGMASWMSDGVFAFLVLGLYIGVMFLIVSRLAGDIRVYKAFRWQLWVWQLWLLRYQFKSFCFHPWWLTYLFCALLCDTLRESSSLLKWSHAWRIT